MKLRTLFLFLPILAACGDASVESGAQDLSGVTDDNLNGIWSGDTVIESWSAIGVRLHTGSSVRTLTRSDTSLSGPGISLTIDPKGYGVNDDVIDGTIDGQTVHLARDTA